MKNKKYNCYGKLAANIQNKECPDGFRITKECCINCIHCYDESNITVCTKFNWFAVEWFNVCNCFE
jgi:hypothetical protein